MAGWTRRLETGLSPGMVDWVRLAGTLARASGFRAYLVGGVVRDLLLDREARDVDVVVEGDALQLARTIAERSGGRARAHRAFGTASVELPGDGSIDLSSARSEHYSRPAALPAVRAGDLGEDLARRDFTINAMALRIDPADFGALVDPFGGEDDLRRKRIRVLHDQSFRDDPTRAFRAVRFAVRLGFRIDTESVRAIQAARRSGVFGLLTPRRLGREIELLLDEGRSARAVESLGRLELLSAVDRSLPFGRTVADGLRRADRALAWHARACPGEAIRRWTVPFNVLLRRVRNETRSRVVDRIRPDGKARHMVLEAPMRIRAIRSKLAGSRLRGSRVHDACRDHPPEIIVLAMACLEDPLQRRALARYLTRIRHTRLEISGVDLMRAGIPRGPAVSRGLRAALRAKLDGRASDRDAQIRAALAR